MNPHQDETVRNSLDRLAANAALLIGASIISAPVHSADVILLGSDYFMTIQPTTFIPAGALNPFAGLPVGPGLTDTTVQRQANCSLTLLGSGTNCTIPVEMVALSLVSAVNSSFQIRESPTLASAGSMTITSNGSGTGGTFTSFFDVFFEISTNGGATWAPQGDLIVNFTNSAWTTIPNPNVLVVPGLIAIRRPIYIRTKGTASACLVPLARIFTPDRYWRKEMASFIR